MARQVDRTQWITLTVQPQVSACPPSDAQEHRIIIIIINVLFITLTCNPTMDLIKKDLTDLLRAKTHAYCTKPRRLVDGFPAVATMGVHSRRESTAVDIQKRCRTERKERCRTHLERYKKTLQNPPSRARYRGTSLIRKRTPP